MDPPCQAPRPLPAVSHGMRRMLKGSGSAGTGDRLLQPPRPALRRQLPPLPPPPPRVEEEDEGGTEGEEELEAEEDEEAWGDP